MRYGRKAVRRAVGVLTREEIEARIRAQTETESKNIEEGIRNEMAAKVKGSRYGMAG